jgi:hypothetical protein
MVQSLLGEEAQTIFNLLEERDRAMQEAVEQCRRDAQQEEAEEESANAGNNSSNVSGTSASGNSDGASGPSTTDKAVAEDNGTEEAGNGAARISATTTTTIHASTSADTAATDSRVASSDSATNDVVDTTNNTTSLVSSDGAMEVADDAIVTTTAGTYSSLTLSLQPLHGPHTGSTSVSSTVEWTDSRLCCLCKSNDEDSLHGRLVPCTDGLLAHLHCLLWCPEVRVSNGTTLANVQEALDKALATVCFYCRLPGASAHCSHRISRKKCRRAFHLQCALAAHAVLVESADTNNTNNSNNDSNSTNSNPNKLLSKSVYCFCPLHAVEMWAVAGPGAKLWSPSSVKSALLLDCNVLSTDSEEVAHFVCRSADKSIRMGAFVLLHLGEVSSTSTANMHTAEHIYPAHYRAARIFWSTHRPGQRTVYILEILYEKDLCDLDISEIEYIARCVQSVHSTNPSIAYPTNTQELFRGPVFRCVALDCAQQPLYAKCVNSLYSFICEQVLLCNSATNSRMLFSSRPDNSASFGLTGHQFLGVGLPIVRRCVEMLPNSIACMLPFLDELPTDSISPAAANTSYRPSYKLPSTAEVQALLKKRQEVQQARINKSVFGSCRADPYVPARNYMTTSRTRKLLAKGVEDVLCTTSAPGNSNDEEAEVDQVELDLELENSRAQEEARRQRYLAMSRAYAQNPLARLEVRKSLIHNWGLFARIGFEKDDCIVEYIGEKIRTVVADKREVEYEQQGVGSCYLFR